MRNGLPSEQNKSHIGQITALFFIQASAAAAFAVFFSGLSLYLTQKELYSKESAAIVTGLFLSFNYILQLVGGFMANRIITYKKMYCLGSAISVMGCLLLAYGVNSSIGLSLFLMSSLVTNVCLRMFITRLFHDEQVTERRVAFLWNYVGMNLGFLIGGFLSGYYTLLNSYSHLFIIMSALSSVSVILTMTFIDNNYQDNTVNKSSVVQLVQSALIMSGIAVLIFIMFSYPEISQQYSIIFSVVSFCGLIHYGYMKSGSTEKKKFLQFSFYSLLAIIFWAAYMLTPTALMQIIDNDVEQKILGITLAPQWLVSVDTIVILLGAPLFAFILNRQHNKKIESMRTASYFTSGFFFVGVAFLILTVGLHVPLAHFKLSLLTMLGYLVFLTIAEILISPIGNSLIGELVPASMRDFMTGASSINIGIGGLLSSLMANKFILPYVNKNGLVGISLLSLQKISLVITVGAFVLAGLLFLLFSSSKYRQLSYVETKSLFMQ